MKPPPNYEPPTFQPIDDFTGIQECSLCGALVRVWGRHAEWHLALTGAFQMLSAVVGARCSRACAVGGGGRIVSAETIAQACPVCGGRGWMPIGFFTGMTMGTSTAPETCRPCSGSGLIWPGPVAVTQKGGEQ